MILSENIKNYSIINLLDWHFFFFFLIGESGSIKHALLLLIGLFLLVRPSCTVFGHYNHVGIVSFVFRLQARQMSWWGHTPGCGHFTKTLQAMSRNYWETKHVDKEVGPTVVKGLKLDNRWRKSIEWRNKMSLTCVFLSFYWFSLVLIK